MTNWIQNHVLLELTRNATRRYSELKPRDVEGNLFMYHLKGLLNEGLIEKTGTAYGLTAKGKQFAGVLSLQTGRPRVQPKILTAVICKNDAGEYLFSRWHRQPNIGQISFPHGMVHFGEKIADMAALELAEKAGLQADLVFKGNVYIRGLHQNQTDRHMLVHVFEAGNTKPVTSNQRPDVSEPFWADPKSLKPTDFVPGFYEIMQLALTPNIPALSEIDVQI